MQKYGVSLATQMRTDARSNVPAAQSFSIGWTMFRGLSMNDLTALCSQPKDAFEIGGRSRKRHAIVMLNVLQNFRRIK